MATNWVTITAEDVQAALAAGPLSATQVDEARVGPVLAQVVARVRGTISEARQEVSSTAGTVPPGPAQQHVPVLTAWALAASTPWIASLLTASPDGSTSRGLVDMYEAAEKWLQGITDGKVLVVEPTDSASTTTITYTVASGGVRLTREAMNGL